MVWCPRGHLLSFLTSACLFPAHLCLQNSSPGVSALPALPRTWVLPQKPPSTQAQAHLFSRGDWTGALPFTGRG